MTPSDATGFHTLRIISGADAFNRWMYTTIHPFLKGSVLEIGSGIGNISRFAVQDGLSISLSDYDPQYCTYLKERFAGCANVVSVQSIDLQCPDFSARYADLESQYDSIFLLNVIEHLADDAAAIANCRFLLREGGNLVLLAPAYAWMYAPLDKGLGHYRRYTTHALARLTTGSGMTLLHRRYFNMLGMAGWIVFGKIFRQRRIEKKEMRFYNQLVPIARFLDRLVGCRTGLSAIVVAQKKGHAA